MKTSDRKNPPVSSLIAAKLKGQHILTCRVCKEKFLAESNGFLFSNICNFCLEEVMDNLYVDKSNIHSG